MSRTFDEKIETINIRSSLPSKITSGIKDGTILAGDDFIGEQLSTWFAQEKEAYYMSDCGNSSTDKWYTYMHFLNEKLGFSRITLPKNRSGSILVLGPGSGSEISKFASDNPEWSLVFLEASDHFKADLKTNYPESQVLDAVFTGDIPIRNESQDVICAFSVLHHIPNVSHVLGEVYRVMKPTGLFLVREPCSSMGDWRFPRLTTPNERGISMRWLTAKAKDTGFVMENKPVPILFAPLNVLFIRIGVDSWITSRIFYLLDRFVSFVASTNDNYWRDAWYKKFGPSAYFYIFRKVGGHSSRI